jgi:hypothetical protein
MLIFNYKSKKELKASLGQALDYTETSFFVSEYTANGTFAGSNRPSITGIRGREFFARVTVKDHVITKVV